MLISDNSVWSFTKFMKIEFLTFPFGGGETFAVVKLLAFVSKLSFTYSLYLQGN